MAALLRGVEDGNGNSDRPKLAPDIEALRLRDALAAFQTKHEFKVGDIVRQKPQATLYAGFGDNDLAIVVDLLPTPIFTDKKDHGSPYFNLPLDIVIGSLESRGNFCLYHVDSRRFEPAPAEVLALLADESQEPS